MAAEPLLSVILPAHNEAENIPKMARRLAEVLTAAHIRYEVLFVNDGSTDNSWDVIRQTAQAYPQVRGIRFSRAFGKEAALYAGLQAARGDCCVTLDCDLQHPVETIPEMYRLWAQGIEVVEGVKRERGTESAAHRTAARWFYRLISKAAKTDLRSSSDFKLLDRKAVLVLLNLPERDTFYRALSAWVGFRTARVEFDVQPRTAGQSSWSAFSLIRYAISSLASFTSAPLYLVILMGFLMLIATLLVGGGVIPLSCRRSARRLHHGHPAAALHRHTAHVQPRHHRLLPRQDLRRSQAPPPLCHRRNAGRRSVKKQKIPRSAGPLSVQSVPAAGGSLLLSCVTASRCGRTGLLRLPQPPCCQRPRGCRAASRCPALRPWPSARQRLRCTGPCGLRPASRR